MISFYVSNICFIFEIKQSILKNLLKIKIKIIFDKKMFSKRRSNFVKFYKIYIQFIKTKLKKKE